MFIIKIILVVTFISLSESYRILGVFPYNGRSHDSMFSALVKGLARHNHQVDVITHFPDENPPPNYKVVVDLSGSINNTFNTLSIAHTKSIVSDLVYSASVKFGNDLCKLLELEKMQTFIKNLPNGRSYDLVITEAMGANCYFGFGKLLQVPVVGVSTFAELPWIAEYMGSSDNPAFVPNVLTSSFDFSSFWDRFVNTISYRYHVHKFQRLTSVQTEMMRKYMSPDMPDVRELERNLSLLLTNRHPLTYDSKPNPGSVIEVSALHINANNSKLSPQLQEWLDESRDGVIYFTFGSMVLIESLPTEKIQDFYKSFAKLAPIRVLMKIVEHNKLPPGLPTNILTLPWIPQQAVLNHKNVRVFISHGGLMSCQEALYFGVPIIGIPLYGDQRLNIAKLETKKIAIKIDYENITETSLDEALSTILTKSMYKQNMKYYSKLFKDRPMEAMDTAVFWIEYAIRNDGRILKSSAIELSWWQLALFDVYGFILLCTVLVITLVFYSIKFVMCEYFSQSTEKNKRE